MHFQSQEHRHNDPKENKIKFDFGSVREDFQRQHASRHLTAVKLKNICCLTA